MSKDEAMKIVAALLILTGGFFAVRYHMKHKKISGQEFRTYKTIRGE